MTNPGSSILNRLYKQRRVSYIILILIAITLIIGVTAILLLIKNFDDTTKSDERKYIILFSVTGILCVFIVLLYFFYLK